MFSQALKAIFLLLLIGATAFAATSETETKLGEKIKFRKRLSWKLMEPRRWEEFSIQKIDELGKRRALLISKIVRLLRETTAEDRRQSLILRLGKLYREDYFANLEKSYQLFNKAQTDYVKRGSKGVAPVVNQTEAFASLDKAIETYGDFKKRYAKHPKRDEVLYFLALSYLDKSKVEPAIANFKLLTDEFPKSSYTTEALIELGDYYFNSNQFAVAETHYDRIITMSYKPLLTYAKYKKGWCAYNTGRAQMALDHMKWAIVNEDTIPATRVKIKNEALQDIPLIFADLKKVNEAITFFQGFGEPYFHRGLETMAVLYLERGEHNDSIKLFETLLASDANHVKNPQYEIRIVEALDLKNDHRAAFNRLFLRLPLYLKDSLWQEANAKNVQALRETEQQYEEVTRKYAMAYHQTAQKTNNEEVYDLTKQFYGKYLDFFPRTPASAELRFNLAEIHSRHKEHEEAAKHYYEVYLHPLAGKLKQDAIRHTLSSLDIKLNEDRKVRGLDRIGSHSKDKVKAKDGESLALLPYSAIEAKFISVTNEYLKVYPKSADAPDVLYEQAYLQYSHHDFEKAHRSFSQLVIGYPKHQTTYSAAHLILDILNRQNDYQKLIAVAKKLLEMNDLSKPSFRTEVGAILRQTELKRIQLIEEKGDFKSAGENYVEFTKAYGGQDVVLFEKALHNAAVNFTKAGLALQAVETQEHFLRRFPKSQLRENILVQIGHTYESMAQFDKAAPYFEQLSQEFPKNAQAKSALRLAGLYYWGAGEMEKAEKAMKAFQKANPSETALIERDLGELYRSNGAVEKELAFHRTARKVEGIAPIEEVRHLVRIAELKADKSGKPSLYWMDEAMKVVTEHPKKMKRTKEGVELLARVLFFGAEQKESGFYKVNLTNQSGLEQKLKRKLAFLTELEAEYTKVAALGTNWGLGAIYKTAAAYRRMAQDVKNAPVPTSLTGQQLELYRTEVAKSIITPMNDKANSLAGQCLDKSKELKLLASWTAQCYQLAADISPDNYPRVRTFYLPPLQTALMIPSDAVSKIQPGKQVDYAMPLFSPGLFGLNAQGREMAQNSSMENPPLVGDVALATDAIDSIPVATNYRGLTKERREMLSRSLAEVKPEPKKLPSFAYLNLARLIDAKKALPYLQKTLVADPENVALHNLLGLTQLERGNYTAAKVTWLALVSRGIKNAAIWNNLGVLASIEGKESEAIGYFREAAAMEGSSKEALTNLGFIAIKHRNGAEATEAFQKVNTIDDTDSTALVGQFVAQLQTGSLEQAREALPALMKEQGNNPYARLSAGYFLMDIEKDGVKAQAILNENLTAQGLENDAQFGRALREAAKLVVPVATAAQEKVSAAAESAAVPATDTAAEKTEATPVQE